MPIAESVMTINFLLPMSIDVINFCGVYDSNLRCIERSTGVTISPGADGAYIVKGEAKQVFLAKKVMEQMLKLATVPITHTDIIIISETKHDNKNAASLQGLMVGKTHIKPYTKNQEEYIKKILIHDVTFGVGPAGTGKTYVAMAVALQELKLGNVKRVTLTRPIVETDEHLGFLPGTLEEKIDPYIRPLYDAILDMIPITEFEKLSNNKSIELAPLAYMRGRTLADAFIVLDEAQNTTLTQMRMFLTRLGQNSKMVITGDITQIDLKETNSGLIDALDKLKSIEDVAIHRFVGADTVRHGLVKKIIEAYEK